MDEEYGQRLTAEGFELLASGNLEDIDPEMLFVMRVMQSYEALEYGPVPDSELEKVYDWADRVMTEWTMLDMVLKGQVYIAWSEPDNDVGFRMAPGGMEIAKEMGFEIPEMPEIPED